MKDRGKTTAELMLELSTDPDYLKRMQAQEEARQKFLEERRKVAAPVAEALQKVGVEVESIWQLEENARLDPKAINVLLKQLKEKYPDYVQEAILRALTTPDARGHWDELVAIFEKNAVNLAPSIRYVAALAVGTVADDDVLDDVIRMIKDQRLGADRAPLLLALIRSKTSKAKMLLLELRDDAVLGKEIKKMRRLQQVTTRKVDS